jgi:peptide-O-fucosyltransferase
MARASFSGSAGKENDCNAKDGNPFKSFWDTYGVDFDRSEFYKPLYYNTESASSMREWNDK